MKLLFSIFTLILLASGFAQADQCSWNNKSVASLARGYLAYSMKPVYSFCKPCGDVVMKSIFYGHDYEETKDKRSIHFRDQDKTNNNESQVGSVDWQFILNEKYPKIERYVDLAYLYEKTEYGYINLGVRFSCKNNRYWNPKQLKEQEFNIPTNVVPYYMFEDSPPIKEDVTESDFMDAHEARYPNKPQG